MLEALQEIASPESVLDQDDIADIGYQLHREARKPVQVSVLGDFPPALTSAKTLAQGLFIAFTQATTRPRCPCFENQHDVSVVK